MTDHSTMQDFQSEHQPDAIRRRLASQQNPSYLGDAVLGGIDGCVTTFAIGLARPAAGSRSRWSSS